MIFCKTCQYFDEYKSIQKEFAGGGPKSTRFFRPEGFTSYEGACCHPDCFKGEPYINPVEQGVKHVRVAGQGQLNAHNDCKHYIKKKRSWWQRLWED